MLLLIMVMLGTSAAKKFLVETVGTNSKKIKESRNSTEFFTKKGIKRKLPFYFN